MDKGKIKNLIANGRIENALEVLILQVNEIDNEEVRNGFIIQSGRLQRILREKNLGTVTTDNTNVTINQITSSVLSMIDDIEIELNQDKQNVNINQKENILLAEISSIVSYKVNSFPQENKKSILHQLELFKINKQNLEAAEKASAKWGELVPTIITHRINDENEKISQIITQLKKLL